MFVSSIRDSRKRQSLRSASRILSLMVIVARMSKPGQQSQSMLGVACIPLYPHHFAGKMGSLSDHDSLVNKSSNSLSVF